MGTSRDSASKLSCKESAYISSLYITYLVLQEDYNKASKGLSKALNKLIKKKSNEWRYANFKVPKDTAESTPEIVDFSPGWFMQRQDVRIIS